MQGMEIAEKYYEQYGLPMVREVCPELEERAAFGLVGEGSQCFGYDDEISRDHDFGPGFCIWLLEDDFANYGGRLHMRCCRRSLWDFQPIIYRTKAVSG